MNWPEIVTAMALLFTYLLGVVVGILAAKWEMT